MEVPASREQETQTETVQQRKLAELDMVNYYVGRMYDFCHRIGDDFGDHVCLLAGNLRKKEGLTAEEILLVEKLEAEQQNFWKNYKVFKEGLSGLNDCLLELADEIDPDHVLEF